MPFPPLRCQYPHHLGCILYLFHLILVVDIHRLPFLHDCVKLVANFLFGVFVRPAELLRDIYVQVSGVAMASFFFLVNHFATEFLQDVCPYVNKVPLSLRIPPRSRFPAFGRHRSLHSRRFEITLYGYRHRGSHCHVDVHVTSRLCSCSRYITCSVTDKMSPCRRFCRSVTRALGLAPAEEEDR